MISIHLNGEVRPIDEPRALADLIEGLQLPQKRIAVELNGSVIRRADWPRTQIDDGDKIEVVHFVGGG